MSDIACKRGLASALFGLIAEINQMNRNHVNYPYARAGYSRYLRHCGIYNLYPLVFAAWLVTA